MPPTKVVNIPFFMRRGNGVTRCLTCGSPIRDNFLLVSTGRCVNPSCVRFWGRRQASESDRMPTWLGRVLGFRSQRST